MSLNSSRNNLLKAMKELRQRWDRVREHWDDPVSRDIEKNVIDELDTKVRNAAHAMNQMSEAMHSARRDCE